VGDSASGKTFLSITCFAEAAINKRFSGYRLIYDNIEDGCLLDLKGLFSEEVAKRIEPPSVDGDGEPIFSSTAEEFYYNIDDAVADKVPFIYVLDSMDALDSESADKKFQEHKNAYRKGTADKVAGSYGDGKAKINSTSLRKVLKGLRDTGSILIIVSQTRDNIGSMFGGKTRGGGHALRFYATVEIWSSIKGSIKKTVRGKARKIGVHVCLQVKKNRITGKTPEVEIDIYPSFGIDDVGSCIDYLLAENWWAMKKQSIIATEFDIVATRDKLISLVEEKKLQGELRVLVGRCWREIEDASAIKRVNRYESAVGTD
jgi:RecA/RadA recombinase